MEREVNTVDCGAQFAMPRSIKLHGGNTVLNTIKAIKAGGKKGIYIYIYINSKKKKKKRRSRKTKPCKISRAAHRKKNKEISSELVKRRQSKKSKTDTELK